VGCEFADYPKWSEWPDSAWESVDTYLLAVPVSSRWIEIVAVLGRDLWKQRLNDVEYELVPKFLAGGRATLTSISARDLFTKWRWDGNADFLRSSALFGAAPEEAMKAFPHGYHIVATETDWDLSFFEPVILEAAEFCDESDDAALLTVLRVDPCRAPFQKKLRDVLTEGERWSVLCEYEGFSSDEAVMLIERMGEAPLKVLRQVEPLSLVFPLAETRATLLSQLSDFDPKFCCSLVPNVDVHSVTSSRAPWFGAEKQKDFELASRLLKAGISLPSAFPTYEFCDYAWENQDWDSVVRLRSLKNLGRRFVSQLGALKNAEDAFQFLSQLPLDARTQRFMKRFLRANFKPTPAYLYASAAIEMTRATSSTCVSPVARKHTEKPPVIRVNLNLNADPIIQDVVAPFEDDNSCPSISDSYEERAEFSSDFHSGELSDSCPEITDDEGFDGSDSGEEEIDTWLIDVVERPTFWRQDCPSDTQLAHVCFAASACECGALNEKTKQRLWEKTRPFLPNAWQARRILRACPESFLWAEIRMPLPLDALEDLVDAGCESPETRAFLESVAQPQLLEGPHERAVAKAYRRLGDVELLTHACTKATHPVVWTLYCDNQLASSANNVLRKQTDSIETPPEGVKERSDVVDRIDCLKDRARDTIRECLNDAPFSVPKNAAEAVQYFREREDGSRSETSVRCLFALWLLWPQVVRSTFEESHLERKLTLGLCKSVAPALISCSIQNARKVLVAAKPSGVDVKLRYMASARQATLTFKRDELVADLMITFGEAFPLTAPRMTPPECVSGIPKARFRNWLLVCQNGIVEGSMGNALLVWVHNFALFFDGLEDCPICYSVVHAQTGAAPRKPCPTCKYKFHSECLFKWFRTSNKATCPLCNQPF